MSTTATVEQESRVGSKSDSRKTSENGTPSQDSGTAGILTMLGLPVELDMDLIGKLVHTVEQLDALSVTGKTLGEQKSTFLESFFSSIRQYDKIELGGIAAALSVVYKSRHQRSLPSSIDKMLSDCVRYLSDKQTIPDKQWNGKDGVRSLIRTHFATPVQWDLAYIRSMTDMTDDQKKSYTRQLRQVAEKYRQECGLPVELQLKIS